MCAVAFLSILQVNVCRLLSALEAAPVLRHGELSGTPPPARSLAWGLHRCIAAASNVILWATCSGRVPGPEQQKPANLLHAVFCPLVALALDNLLPPGPADRNSRCCGCHHSAAAGQRRHMEGPLAVQAVQGQRRPNKLQRVHIHLCSGGSQHCSDNHHRPDAGRHAQSARGWVWLGVAGSCPAATLPRTRPAACHPAAAAHGPQLPASMWRSGMLCRLQLPLPRQPVQSSKGVRGAQPRIQGPGGEGVSQLAPACPGCQSVHAADSGSSRLTRQLLKPGNGSAPGQACSRVLSCLH